MVAADSPAQLGGLLTGLVPGSRVAGYLLERLVGVGGTAAVFRARDERLGRMVALKLLTGDEGVRRRFAREARAVAAVDHPHIIPIYEAGEASGVLFIAMRFVAGDDLRVVVGREGSLRPRRAAAFISPVASALDAAHGAGLVHRDVKPANMLVDVGPGRPEHVYLSDFGLARGISSLGGPTRAGQFLGTPGYAAPEQISGRPVDGRADQYALACVAYTLLSGSLPFVREEPMAVLYAHLFAPPPRVTSMRPDLPTAVDQVLARALSKAPEDRYGSCGAFADALRDALGWSLTIPPGMPSTGPGTRRRACRARLRTHRDRGAGRCRGARDRPSLMAGHSQCQWHRELQRTVPLTVPPDSPATPLPAGASPSAPIAVSPLPPPDPLLPPIAAGTWTAVVTADRAYYESVRLVSDEDAGSGSSFPSHVPERRFRLSGTEIRIGRRSVSRRIEPEST